MSVMNRMLRDLDRRRGLSMERPDILAGVEAVDAGIGNGVRPMARAGGYLLLALAAILAGYQSAPYLNGGYSPGGRHASGGMPRAIPDAPIAVEKGDLRLGEITDRVTSLPPEFGLQMSDFLPFTRLVEAKIAAPAPGKDIDSPPNTRPVPVRVSDVSLRPAEGPVDAGRQATEQDHDEGLAIYRQAVTTADDHQVFPGSMEKKAVTLSPARIAQQHYLEALRLLQVGRRGEAERRLHQAATIYPGHDKATQLLAARLEEAGRYAAAEQVLRQGLKAAPGSISLIKLLARLKVKIGDSATALKILDTVSPPVADEPEYHALRAALHRKTGDYGGAVEIYRKLTGLRPDLGIWWMGLAVSLETLNTPEEALGAYRKAAEQEDLSRVLSSFVRSRINRLQAGKTMRE